MNKRLIALFLCLVMMLSVCLAGCAESSEEDAKNELEQAKVASNMTLTMWIVSESPVSEEIRNDVTNAINALTRTKYKTQLDIQYLSEEEYFSKLTNAMEAYAENKKQQNAGKPVETETGTSGEETGTTIEEVVTDEHGMYRDNYPIVLENQVDIIYIGDVKDGQGNLLMSGQQMYNELRADDWLAPLDDAIKGDAKKIKEFVSPTLLSAVQEKGATYAIPSNNVIGEYTYMCLNKSLMDKYSLQGHLTRGSIKSFANEYVYQFIDQIARYESKDKDLLPIDATYEECLAQLAYYWNVDPEDYSISTEEFSIFGTPLFNTQLSRGQNIAGVQSLFENEEFVENYLAINEYRLEAAYRFVQTGTDEQGNPIYAEDKSEKITFFRNEENKDKEYGTYGIKFVKGTLEALNAKGNYVDPQTGVEYYAIPVAYPTATAEDIYGNMFAVAKTTLSVERSMQIITYLNTNQEIRNLLQYGIEGQHYTVQKVTNESGETVKSIKRQADKKGNEYVMDLYATGNVFLAHILDEENTNYAIWVNGKKQNRDSLVEPMLGFDLGEYAQTATQFGTPTTVNAVKQYKTTFRSELSKDNFANDEVLSAWLKQCDEQGKGVYVFRSRQETANKEYDEILYFYNNTGSYRFSVETVEESKEGGGFYRNNTYIYTKATKEDKLPVNYGYTLTMVYDVCPTRYVKTIGEEGQPKVEAPLSIVNRTLNSKGEEDENSRTACEYVETFTYKTTKYDFDLYATESYELNVYGDLYLGDFYDNKIIYSELKKLLEKITPNVEKNEKAVKENLGLHWVDTTSSDEKDYHSFIFYRANIEYTTLIDIIPSISNDRVTLIVNYDEREHNGEIKDPANYNPNTPGVRPGKRYMLYYVTLETEKGVDISISYNLSTTTEAEVQMGQIVQEYTADKTAINNAINGVDTWNGLVEIITPADYEGEGPYVDFDVCGLLNTEVVKYMAELNDLVVGLLDECDTMDALEKRVAYFQLLLNTEAALSGTEFPTGGEEYDAKIDALIKDNSSIIYKGDFINLFYQLTHITNYGTMEDVKGELTAIGSGVAADREEYRAVSYSPYGIYYLWMEAYQYLPANMQTGTN